jgi:hypothetical protein
MARGFESKAVESQIEDKKRELHISERPDEEQNERSRKIASLEMSKGRITRELETAESDVHRTALKNALDHLNRELKASE